jgi:hypothetical protein
VSSRACGRDLAAPGGRPRGVVGGGIAGLAAPRGRDSAGRAGRRAGAVGAGRRASSAARRSAASSSTRAPTRCCGGCRTPSAWPGRRGWATSSSRRARVPPRCGREALCDRFPRARSSASRPTSRPWPAAACSPRAGSPRAARPRAARPAGRGRRRGRRAGGPPARPRGGRPAGRPAARRACTPAAPTTCRCTPRCRSWPGPGARSRSLLLAAGAARPSRRSAGPVFAGPARRASAGCRPRCARRAGARSGSGTTVRCARAHARRLAAGHRARRRRRRCSRPTPSCSPSRRPRGPPAARRRAVRGRRRRAASLRQRRHRHAGARRAGAGHAAAATSCPAVEGRTTKAVTFTSRKWDALRRASAVVRASVGGRGGGRPAARRRRAGRGRAAPSWPRPSARCRPCSAPASPAGAAGCRSTPSGHLERVRRACARRWALPGLAVARCGVRRRRRPACVASGQDGGATALAALPGAVLEHNGTHDRT